MSKDKAELMVKRIEEFFETHVVMSLEGWKDLLFAIDAEIPEDTEIPELRR